MSHIRFPLSRQELFFAAVYFVQAAVSVSAIAQFIFTRQELGLSYLQLGVLAALPTIAWSVKPIYGFLTDLIPIRGYRRRYYLRIAPLLTTLSWLYIWLYAHDFSTFAIPLIIANVGLGFTDVLCDALVVDESTPQTAGRYQSLCWGALSTGAIVATFLSGFLLTREIVELRTLFLITALVPLITFTLSFFVRDVPVTPEVERAARRDAGIPYIAAALVALAITVALLWPREGASASLASLGVIGVWAVWIMAYFTHLVRARSLGGAILFAAAFIFLWRFTPTFGAPWQEHFLSRAGMSAEILGYAGVMNYLGWLIGAVLYAKLLDRFPIKKVLLWTIMASAIGLLQLLLVNVDAANAIGSHPLVVRAGAALTAPLLLVSNTPDAWGTALAQPGIVHLNMLISLLLGILYMLAYLPLLKFAALSTPKGLEGTNFAIMMSIMNFGLAFGSVSGGFIFEKVQLGWHGYSALELTVWIGVLTSYLALLVLPKLRLPESEA